MNGIFDERRNVKEYEFHKPLLSKIDSISDNCIRDCKKNYYHTHRFTLEYNTNFTNKRNNEMYSLPNSNIAVGSYELNEKIKVAR